jgi:hypothetical protein
MAWFVERPLPPDPIGEIRFEYLCDVELDRWTSEPLKARYFRSYQDAESRIKRSGEKVVYWDSVTRCFPSRA